MHDIEGNVLFLVESQLRHPPRYLLREMKGALHLVRHPALHPGFTLCLRDLSQVDQWYGQVQVPR